MLNNPSAGLYPGGSAGQLQCVSPYGFVNGMQGTGRVCDGDYDARFTMPFPTSGPAIYCGNNDGDAVGIFEYFSGACPSATSSSTAASTSQQGTFYSFILAYYHSLTD